MFGVWVVGSVGSNVDQTKQGIERSHSIRDLPDLLSSLRFEFRARRRSSRICRAALLSGVVLSERDVGRQRSKLPPQRSDSRF